MAFLLPKHFICVDQVPWSQSQPSSWQAHQFTWLEPRLRLQTVPCKTPCSSLSEGGLDFSDILAFSPAQHSGRASLPSVSPPLPPVLPNLLGHASLAMNTESNFILKKPRACSSFNYARLKLLSRWILFGKKASKVHKSWDLVFSLFKLRKIKRAAMTHSTFICTV